MFKYPHKIGISLQMWRGTFLGKLRLKRTVIGDETYQNLYYEGDPKFPVKLDASELLSEEWETYEL
jgi:hypothetical protein